MLNIPVSPVPLLQAQNRSADVGSILQVVNAVDRLSNSDLRGRKRVLLPDGEAQAAHDDHTLLPLHRGVLFVPPPPPVPLIRDSVFWGEDPPYLRVQSDFDPNPPN